MKKKIYTLLIILVSSIFLWWKFDSESLKIVTGFLFVTDKNKMNWIGLTGIIAIAGLIYNLYDGRRRFRGDIRSKSRIDWMKSVRPLIADYVTNVSKYMYLYDVFAFKTDPVERENINEKLSDTMQQIKSGYYQIKLYVPNNQSNKQILKNIELLFDELSYIVLYYDKSIGRNKIYKDEITDYQSSVQDYISDVMNQTINESSEYFKKEWEKAKKGK
ncbi:hypothetical protein [Leuconostoc mesenteroides]|uniref:hypothetical protein n=1 Tax=Leuconostoc mesenteroides TaxID=1245 RepID=UPI0010AE0641|nr:hypothetical protein [Leuconostoc mesenteroides]TJY30602.1 hypothetical protein FCF26_05180 [Leuconostoc mesenteroides subsp. mesenteroides]